MLHDDMLQTVTMSRRCLNNKFRRILLNEYTKQNVLDESTFRKNCLEDCYNLSIFHIQENIGLVFRIFADKDTDTNFCCIATLIVGNLCEKT